MDEKLVDEKRESVFVQYCRARPSYYIRGLVDCSALSRMGDPSRLDRDQSPALPKRVMSKSCIQIGRRWCNDKTVAMKGLGLEPD